MNTPSPIRRLVTYNVTLNAGEMEKNVPLAGDKITVLEASHTFIVSVEKSGSFHADRVGRYSLDAPDGRSVLFEGFVIRRKPETNPNDVVKITLQVGLGVSYIDGRVQFSADQVGLPIMEAPSALESGGGGILGSGQTYGLGAGTDGRQRKAAIVTNLDPGNRLTVTDASGATCFSVGPLETHRLDFSELFFLKNENAAPVAFQCGAIWYLKK